MTTRLRPQKRNFQYLETAFGFLPFLLWAGAVWVGWEYWRKPFGLLGALGVAWLGGQTLRLLIPLRYQLSYWGLRLPSKGRPGVDVLAFSAEPPETRHKIKIVAEDAGLLFAEDAAFRMVTILQDYRIPFDRLSVEPWMKGEKVDGLLFRFVPEGQNTEISFVAALVYAGGNLEVAADHAATAKWAIEVISSIRERHSVPQALATAEG